MSAISQLWGNAIFTDVAEVVDFVANGSFASLKENVTYLEHGYAVLVRLTDWKKKWNGKYVFVSKESYDFLKKSKLESGDIIISCVGEPGQVFQVPDLEKPMTLGPNSVRLREHPNVLHKKYFFYFWKSSVGQKRIKEITSGSTQLKFNKTGLRATNIVVAPLNEQKRIADKLDSILARVDTCRQRLDRVPVILKRFRQAVLAAATSGVLTRDEGDMQAAQSVVSLKEVLVSIKTGPFGSSLHKSDYIKNGTPVINPMHIVKGKIIPSADTSVSEETLSKLSGFSLSEGDVLIGRRGEMGRCAVVTQKEHGWLCGTGSMILKPVNNLDPNYLQLVLSGRETVKALEAKSVGSTMVNLNQKILFKLKIYYPPLIDQKKIVRRVDSLFAYADRIEARYTIARAQVDKLTPATLAKAFRGELVPQDPNDEPASVLIERIKASHAEKKVTSKSKRGRNKAISAAASN